MLYRCISIHNMMLSLQTYQPQKFLQSLVIVDGDVTTPRLYFKTVRESFQLIRLLVDRKVYDLIAYDVSDDRLYVQLVDSAIYYPNDRGSHDEHGFYRVLPRSVLPHTLRDQDRRINSRLRTYSP